MQFSEYTMEVLKNFSTINSSLMFKSGNVIRTISPQKTIMASSTVDETFDKEAGVYDLSRFIATMSLFKEPDVMFGDNSFNIVEGGRSVQYTYAAESMIITPPAKNIKLPSVDVSAQLNWKDIQSVVKAAGVLGLPEISFSGDGETIRINAKNSENPTADHFSIEIETDNVPEMIFEAFIKTEHMKLLPNDYMLEISSKGLSHFKSDRIEYWISVEQKNSNFGV
jgi:hypothetical protein